ncbi:MAG: VOC family protein [Myxococcota bacterium]
MSGTRMVWHELVTPNLALARTFYGELLGWKLKSVPVLPDLNYSLIEVGGTRIGGMIENAAIPSAFWMGYAAVDNVDVRAELVAGAGGRVVSAPQTVPELGRFALVADPAGAPIGLSDGRAREAASGRSCFCWDELMAPSAADLAPFYARVLGWRADPYGGIPGTWILKDGEEQVASLTEGVAAPHWLSHVLIDDLDAAILRAHRLGGQLRREVQVVPAVGRFAVIGDPSGASLALFEAKDLERDLR